MVAIPAVHIGDAARRLTISVRVKGVRRWRARCFIGARIIRLGAWVMGTRGRINIERN